MALTVKECIVTLKVLSFFHKALDCFKTVFEVCSKLLRNFESPTSKFGSKFTKSTSKF